MPDSRTSSPKRVRSTSANGDGHAAKLIAVEALRSGMPLMNRRNQQNGVTLSPLESLKFSQVLPESHTLISASATQCGLTVGLCPSAKIRQFCLRGKGKAPPDDRAAPRPIPVGCQA